MPMKPDNHPSIKFVFLTDRTDHLKIAIRVDLIEDFTERADGGTDISYECARNERGSREAMFEVEESFAIVTQRVAKAWDLV